MCSIVDVLGVRKKGRKVIRRGVGGFTLVEVLIVVVILGILATAVVGVVGGQQEDARTATARATLRAMQDAVQRYHARYGTFPEEISGAWFSGGTVPLNPLAPFEDGDGPVEIKTCDHDHPAPKMEQDKVDKGELAGWWYLQEKGRVRARVSSQYASDPLATFRLINGCDPES